MDWPIHPTAVASLQVVACVLANALFGNCGFVGLFLVQRQLMIGHPVQLEAEGTRLIQAQRRECLDGKIPSQVAMELPVVGISGVTVFG